MFTVESKPVFTGCYSVYCGVILAQGEVKMPEMKAKQRREFQHQEQRKDWVRQGQRKGNEKMGTGQDEGEKIKESCIYQLELVRTEHTHSCSRGFSVSMSV